MTSLRIAIFFCLLPVHLIHAADDTLLRIHGSNTVGASLAPALLEAWLTHKGYTNIRKRKTAEEEQLISADMGRGKTLNIELHAHGSSTSFQDLAAGKADLGMSSRPIKDKELKTLAPLGDFSKHNSEYVIALDGLSVIVHPQNPLHSISKARLKQIFSGEVSHWSQLGVSGGRINVYARDDKSGTYDTFKSLVLDKTPLTQTARRYESNTKLSDDVAGDRNGIGFVGLAYVHQSRALAVSDEGAVALPPQPFNVCTEDYALARRLFLYLPEKNHKPLLKEFAEFAVSLQAQAIVDKVGFVSQKIQSALYKLPTSAPEEYRQLTQNARRLPLNIRFRAGDVKLDNKAIRDIERLAAFVKQPENRQKQIMLFGFSDSMEGLPYASYSLSISRSDAVADQFILNHIIPVVTRGFGAELAVASNRTDKGQYKNQRVEVWIR